METYRLICERLHTITHIPMLLTSGDGKILGMWPQMPDGYLGTETLLLLLEDFSLQRRDSLHPLLSYVEPGYFVGVAELAPEIWAIIGLVSPVPHTRQEILDMCSAVIAPSCLRQFCDIMIQMPSFNLYQVKDFICLLVQLSQGQTIPPENILFHDFTPGEYYSAQKLEPELFSRREDADFHVPADYEAGLCDAVEAGNRELLIKRLHTPFQVRVGRMSSSELRQQKYMLISLATQISRAAIRGGLEAETAFSLSDIYCQRADVLTDTAAIQQLSYSMMLDFCDKVNAVRSRPSSSPVVQKCLEYISIHLHEPITLDDLAACCGLCGRSLSLRFKKELAMGIPEYIHREKIREAEYLLRHTDYALAEIAVYLNYPSQSYFTQIFKKYCGKTPQQYRDSPRG